MIQDDCIICMDGYEEDKQAAKLPCGHTFHTACIIAWIDQGKDKCPLCKATIKPGAGDKKDEGGEGNEGGLSSGDEDENLILHRR